MKVKHLFSIIFTASLFFYACDTKTTCLDCTPVADYSKGVFVVNEGPWGGSGTISWYNPDTKEVRDSIFEKANKGAVLGLFVQSLTFHNGKGYIVVNGANRVVVVDAETFVFLDTIGGLALPRYFLPVSDDIGYVSQWGADGISGSVAKVDLKTNKILKTTPTGSGSEKMIYCADSRYLYVANSGGYGVDSTVTSIAVENDDQIVGKRVIPGQRNPCCFTKFGALDFTPWHVLCRGDWADNASEGWLGLAFIDPITGGVIPKGSDDLVRTADGNEYFSSGVAIYKVASAGAPLKLFDQPAYGFNVHPSTGDFYCADGKDFSSAGEVFILQLDGTFRGSFRAGIAPGEIVFVE